MALTYCFESHLIPSVLAKCRRNDLAVVDTEGNEKAVREAGLLRTEGKTYIMQDGDVVEFKFNV